MDKKFKSEAAVISEDKIKQWILDSLSKVKASDPAYASVSLNDQTVILGSASPFDSIAFTAFATDFEEKVEDETQDSYILNVEELFSRQRGKRTISVSELAKLISPAIRKN